MELDDTLATPERGPTREGEPLAAGTRIGRYVVEHVLGAGGMGVVYAARDPELDRTIAVKLLRGAPDLEAHARMRREAQALARVRHANIMIVHDVGDFVGDGSPSVFVAMELIEGGTLRAWQVGRAPRAIVEAYVGAGRGLAAAHARGLVHRDFKPENVLVADDGRPIVTDFGLVRFDGERADGAGARGDDRDLDIAVTAAGAVMGTLGYMPLEQLEGGAVDARADQFAWCVALWEACYGARPFPGGTLAAVAAAMLAGPPPIPDRAEVPRALGEALVRGLAARPDDRWPAMEPLLAACTDAVAPPVAPPTPAPRRSRARLIAGVALAIVAACAIAFAVTRRGGDAPPPPTPVAAAACATSAARLAEAWDRPRHDAMLAHFGATPRSDVASARDLVVRDLDTYASTWATQWDAACASDEAVKDPLLHAQRMNCLERSFVDLEGVAAAIAAVDPIVFTTAWKGNLFTEQSSPLADCVNVARVRAMPPAPTEAQRAEVARLVVAMHVARVAARASINNGAKPASFA